MYNRTNYKTHIFPKCGEVHTPSPLRGSAILTPILMSDLSSSSCCIFSDRIGSSVCIFARSIASQSRSGTPTQPRTATWHCLQTWQGEFRAITQVIMTENMAHFLSARMPSVLWTLTATRCPRSISCFWRLTGEVAVAMHRRVDIIWKVSSEHWALLSALDNRLTSWAYGETITQSYLMTLEHYYLGSHTNTIYYCAINCSSCLVVIK